jgi:type IV pilus assembly protein PilX
VTASARSTLRRRQQHQRGAALVCALLLMLATMLVGVAISRAAFASIASAGAERERGLAREAAEAALRDAERDIAVDAATSADPARAAQFTPAGAGGFVEGCGRGAVNRGLCLAASPPAWQALDLAEGDSPALVPYGHYTGASLATGKGLLPARAPAYLIEKIAAPGAAASLGSFYRITAIGFGSRGMVQVVLQSVYRKPAPAPAGGTGPPGGEGTGPGGPAGGAAAFDGDGTPAWPGTQDPAAPAQAPAPARPGTGAGSGVPTPPPVPLPAGRIGWREIPNWPQLHALAAE